MDQDPYEAIRSKIGADRACVGIIGLGYVGLPLARAFAAGGIPVLGFDVDPARSSGSARRELHRAHPRRDDPRDARTAASRRPTDFHRLDEPDAIIICVPTPLTDAREPDLTYVVRLGPRRSPSGSGPASSWCWRAPPIPGTTREVVLPLLEAGGLRAGRRLLPGLQPRARGPGQPAASRPRPSPRSSAASTPPASSWPPRSTARSSSGSCPSPAPRSPRPARSSRTPTGPSTSPWSTS